MQTGHQISKFHGFYLILEEDANLPLADKNADMGPLINKKALDNVTGMVKRAKVAGAQVECGGKV